MSWSTVDASPPPSRVRQVDDTPQDDPDDPSQVNQLTFTSLAGTKDPVVKKIGKQTNEIVELVKKQNELFTKHLTGTVDKFQKKSSTKSTSGGKHTTSTDGSNKSSSNKKPWLKNKKGQKSHKGQKRSTVNEVPDEPEEGECSAEPGSGDEDQQSDTASTADL